MLPLEARVLRFLVGVELTRECCCLKPGCSTFGWVWSSHIAATCPRPGCKIFWWGWSLCIVAAAHASVL